ncbi:hypothetical protein G6F68_012702 [Rhizopus microsporus]|nr:hypothetical protein G6F68_012702 [Rhizopus microsporus]
MFLTFSLFSDVSRSSEVSISIYMRHPPSNQGENSGRKNDFFLGGVKIQPTFEAKMEDQVLNIMGGTGVMHLQLCYRPQQKPTPITFDAFELLRVIGRGSFGKVNEDDRERVVDR